MCSDMNVVLSIAVGDANVRTCTRSDFGNERSPLGKLSILGIGLRRGNATKVGWPACKATL